MGLVSMAAAEAASAAAARSGRVATAALGRTSRGLRTALHALPGPLLGSCTMRVEQTSDTSWSDPSASATGEGLPASKTLTLADAQRLRTLAASRRGHMSPCRIAWVDQRGGGKFGCG